MPKLLIIIIVVLVVLILGIFIIPIVNKHQLKNMPTDQQIRILMKQANKLIYWKNISSGTEGTLVYIKNKRKILTFPWVLTDGKMFCTRENPLEKWDYPEAQLPLTDDEVKQALQELEKYNKKSPVKLYLQNTDEN